jgi:four helix bundle protein
LKVFEKNSEYGNPLVDKSFKFAVRILKFYKYQITKSAQYNSLLKQLLRSGTSIGANVSESQESESKKDFIHKLSIALKESRETQYWLRLLIESELISHQEFQSLSDDCEEVIKLLVSIIKKLKESS